MEHQHLTPVRKAVVPVAGLGTRFAPATKAVPKEMLPVVDRPAIQYAVEHLEAGRRAAQRQDAAAGRATVALEHELLGQRGPVDLGRRGPHAQHLGRADPVAAGHLVVVQLEEEVVARVVGVARVGPDGALHPLLLHDAHVPRGLAGRVRGRGWRRGPQPVDLTLPRLEPALQPPDLAAELLDLGVAAGERRQPAQLGAKDHTPESLSPRVRRGAAGPRPCSAAVRGGRRTRRSSAPAPRARPGGGRRRRR